MQIVETLKATTKEGALEMIKKNACHPVHGLLLMNSAEQTLPSPFHMHPCIHESCQPRWQPNNSLRKDQPLIKYHSVLGKLTTTKLLPV
jgi:hypothetical protein